MASGLSLRRAAHRLGQGGLIAYPTEAVYGLGVDPDNAEAIANLLAAKDRDPTKGLILIGADLDALRPYLAPLDEVAINTLTASWPGAITWLVPAADDAPIGVTGASERIAVRIPGHPTARALCRAWGGALTSTSANRRGRAPARTALATRRVFGTALAGIVAGRVDPQAQPSEIRDLASGRVLRPSGAR